MACRSPRPFPVPWSGAARRSVKATGAARIFVMPRSRRIEEPHGARFLTFSCYQRLTLFGTSVIRDAFAEHMLRVAGEARLRFFAWVIMPEHVHLVVSQPTHPQTTASWMQRLKEPFARRVLARWRQLDAPVLARLQDRSGSFHFWQRGGGYDRTLVSRDEVYRKSTYVEENPLCRGLVESLDDWRWSSWFTRCRAVAWPSPVCDGLQTTAPEGSH